jgi:hypothetical protein
LLPLLQDVELDNNNLIGPTPVLRAAATITFSNNGFCGIACAPEVTALLRFLADVGYPQSLAELWAGNDPCKDWLGVFCYQGKVTLLNLPGYDLKGTISDSLGNLTALSDVRLSNNNLTGRVPESLASLKSLKKLDLSTNNLTGPLPAFNHDVNVNITDNPNFNAPPNDSRHNMKRKLALVLGIPFAVILAAAILLGFMILFYKKNEPHDCPGPEDLVRIASTNNNNFGGVSRRMTWLPGDIHIIEAHNFLIPLQVLRDATKNFSQDNVLGRGGAGVVYKGLLHGTAIAVKRIRSSLINNKATKQFQAEIAILTTVRHRNLVSILGYSIEGDERLLVYEHMSNGSLSKHLFQWKLHGLEPLSWMKRFNIALDVARAMEYLHTLAQQCYIHRDLKPANILLGDDFRAKVADFGLVKSTPDGNVPVDTDVAGTFGYLAPEYVGMALQKLYQYHFL